MKNILVTGASGFVGKYFCEFIKSKSDFKIHAVVHSTKRTSQILSDQNINLVQLDLKDQKKVFEAINKIKPDYIIHLAALTSPQKSFTDPQDTLVTNITAELNILEAIRLQNLIDTKLLIISSSEIYGLIGPSDNPVSETTMLKPTSPYAVSKITQDYLGFQYYLTHKIKCIIVRPFNHIGPRQIDKFVISDFSKQIAEIEKGKRKPEIVVGNLNAKRDFTDVRDVVRGYYSLLKKGIPGEVYNIGSGKSYYIKDILNKLIGMSGVKISIKIDENKFKPGDVPDIICDNSKLSKATGWKPEIPLDKTLKDTLDYWRSIV